MPYLIVVVVLAVSVYAISAPLRAQRREGSRRRAAQTVAVAELEAAREAKYREIRDAELDLRTGKLSEEDHAALDASLRAEAIEILHALDRAHAALAGPEEPGDGAGVH